MLPSSYVFRAEGIGKRYGSRTVLRNASVWGAAGQIATLMGRNGSGKTTLLSIAAGVTRAECGMVQLDQWRSSRPRLYEMARRGLMYVPQEFLLMPDATVAFHVQNVAAASGNTAADEAVERAGIGAFMARRSGTLSGGERARVSLAMALIRRPRVLLADEPLVGLSPIDQEAMGDLLRAMADGGAAVITSGHEIAELLRISDTIIWSVAGTTHHLGSPTDARQHSQFVREYLGSWYEMPPVHGTDEGGVRTAQADAGGRVSP